MGDSVFYKILETLESRSYGTFVSCCGMHRNLDSDGYVMHLVTYLQMEGITGGLVSAVPIRESPINNISLSEIFPWDHTFF